MRVASLLAAVVPLVAAFSPLSVPVRGRVGLASCRMASSEQQGPFDKFWAPIEKEYAFWTGVEKAWAAAPFRGAEAARALSLGAPLQLEGPTVWAAIEKESTFWSQVEDDWMNEAPKRVTDAVKTAAKDVEEKLEELKNFKMPELRDIEMPEQVKDAMKDAEDKLEELRNFKMPDFEVPAAFKDAMKDAEDKLEELKDFKMPELGEMEMPVAFKDAMKDAEDKLEELRNFKMPDFEVPAAFKDAMKDAEDKLEELKDFKMPELEMPAAFKDLSAPDAVKKRAAAALQAMDDVMDANSKMKLPNAPGDYQLQEAYSHTGTSTLSR